MKAFRILAISFLALLLAMPALAMNVTTSGNIYQWFGVQNQMPSATDAPFQIWDSDLTGFNNESARHHTRARLYFTAEDDEKKVRGTYGFEIDIDSGEGDGDLGGDGINVETRFAYLDFELPFDPMTRAYLGLQPVGAGSDWVFDDNAHGVKFIRSMGSVTAALGWFRYAEDNAFVHGDESDLYMLNLDFEVQEGTTIGAFVYYTDGANDLTDAETAYATADLAYIGLDGSMEMGNFSGQFTGIYLTGEIADDYDAKSYLVHLEGTYSFDNSYVQLGWYYASGDDDEGDDEDNGYFALGYNASVTNTWTGSMAFFEALDLEAGGWGSPFCSVATEYNFGANVVYLNFGHEFNEKTDGRLGLIWINSAEDYLYASDLGTEFGWEVNGELTYAITENLRFKLGAGYVFAGEAQDELMDAIGLDADDLWRVTSEIKLSF